MSGEKEMTAQEAEQEYPKFADGLKQVLEMDETHYKSFSENCSVQTESKFSKEIEIAGYEALFNTLVKKNYDWFRKI